MWQSGCITINNDVYRFHVKVYEAPNKFGINNGKVSKLSIIKNKELIFNYDRGYDVVKRESFKIAKAIVNFFEEV